MTPIYGHVDEKTAYVVDDYPYGYKLRCKIRYWLEHSPTKGFRFCSQTTNPKKSVEVWNAPKKSTYMRLGGCMFLDENSHVKWTGVSEYSDLATLEKFAADFPGADLEAVNLAIQYRKARG
jgi:hypothetical protein